MTGDTCDFCSTKDKCDGCGKEEAGIAWFAAAFRKVRLKKGQPDPGNLCGSCAGRITGKEIGQEIFGRKA
jgi:hypothetical protein